MFKITHKKNSFTEDDDVAKPDFEQILLEAVDNGLASLGESSKNAIYFHLETAFNVRKQEIPHKIKIFAAAIEKIFGIGANFLEKLILRELINKVGLTDQDFLNLPFTEAVEAIKRAGKQKALCGCA
ncbi:MAG: hypothetical protein QXU99_07815 [Candidatus Bathyarchaeia archaeon]